MDADGYTPTLNQPFVESAPLRDLLRCSVPPRCGDLPCYNDPPFSGSASLCNLPRCGNPTFSGSALL